MSVEGCEPAQSAKGKRVGVAKMETGEGGAGYVPRLNPEQNQPTWGTWEMYAH